MIRIRSFCRLHVGLLDLGNATPRKYGGAGFCISGLPVEIHASTKGRTQLRGTELTDARTRYDLEGALTRLQQRFPELRINLKIAAMPPQHVGLGSKTALILAALMAANISNGIRMRRHELQMLSGRGGTSGVGINAFFTGGFLADCGHDPRTSVGYAPSSATIPFQIPDTACRIRIPANWEFYLALPQGRRTSGGKENRFFEQHTPIPKREVLESISLVYHGLVPALHTRDLQLLKDSLWRLQEIGFKRREVENQPSGVRRLLADLNNSGFAAGMSSLGPLVYAIADHGDKEARRSFQALCDRHNARFIGQCTGRNQKFEVLK